MQAFTHFSYVSSVLLAGMSAMRPLRSQLHSSVVKVSDTGDCTVTQSSLFPNIELPMEHLLKYLFSTSSHIPQYSPL